MQASVVAVPGLQSTGSVAVVRRLSCSIMWDLLRSGIEPASPALAGGFFTTETVTGKPCPLHF